MVQQALDRLRQVHRRTTVVIAHRLSTIQDADRIAVISNKGIAEIGTHSELMAMDGIYTSLCASQVRRNTRICQSKRQKYALFWATNID